MAITRVAVGTIAASTGADITPGLPAGVQQDDIILVFGWVRDVDDTVTVTGYTQIATWDRGTSSRYWLFGKRAGAGETAQVFNKSGATGDTYGATIAYRGCITTETAWEVVGTGSTGTVDPSSITGITTLTDGSMVVVPCGGEDNNNAAITTTGTDPAAYSESYQESATGTDGAVTFSDEIRSAAGATGTISVNWDVAVPVGFGGIAIALKPQPITAAVQDLISSGIIPFER